MPNPLVIRRVLGDQPFTQIGIPAVSARCDSRGLVAFGGDLGRLHWSGRIVGDDWRQHRVGVYALGDLRCAQLVGSRWPVLSLAFHPTLPLLAVGTGSYDGGYSFEGELLLLDLDTGRRISALRHTREVRRARWLDAQRLELVVAPLHDDEDDAAHGMGHTATIERADWTAVTDRSIDGRELTNLRAPFPRPDEALAARTALTDLCTKRGTTWVPRRQVWAVEGLSDGRILAALDGIQLECWDATGTRQWSACAHGGTGCQIHLSHDEQSAWVNVARPYRWGTYGWETPPCDVVRLRLDDGGVIDRIDVAYPVALTGYTDGRFALRDTQDVRYVSGPLRWFSPEGVEQLPVDIGRYDGINHYFDVRHSAEPLFLEGDADKYHRDKWIVTVRDSQVVQLFPLDWRPGNHHLFGGPALRTSDAQGSALVHAGRVHNGHGLLNGNSFVARRRFPDGGMQWVFTCDHPPTALDTDGATVFAAYNSGEVVALDATDGSVVWRWHLTLDGQRVEPLFLSVTGPGQMLLGTVDGRILDCTYTTPKPSNAP